MKRIKLLQHLHQQGCFLSREGKRHSVYSHRSSGRTSTVPRHREVQDVLAEKICKDLGVASIKK